MKRLCIFAAVILIGLFIVLLYKPIEASFHEHDLLWMLPVTSTTGGGHTPIESLKIFLYSPYTASYGDPWMNTYLSFVFFNLGFQIKYFIFAAIVLHLVCAFLIYLLLRNLGLDFRIAFFSALVYFTLFVHFGYYFFPMNAHHLFVVLFSLLVMALYFNTNRRIEEGRSWRPVFWATIFANFLASFCQITILILPIGILTHILISSKDGADRLRRYDTWLVLFVTYLGYPLIRLLYKGFPHLQYFFRMGDKGQVSPLVFPIVFVIGLASLVFFRYILQLSSRYNFGRALKILCAIAGVIYLLAFLAVLGRSDLMTPSKVKLYDWLSPLNIVRPVALMLENLISPIRAALSINSAVIFHVMSKHIGFLPFAMALLFVGIFIKNFLIKYKGLIILALFYIVALRYTRIETSVLPSRHFIYVTPLFSIIFCSAFIYMYDKIVAKIKLRKGMQNIILAAIFIVVSSQNVLAMKLELFRGRLVNTFITYDYIRTSEIIKKDVDSSDITDRVKPANIFVEGVVSMADNYADYWIPQLDWHLKYGMFRYVFAQVLGDKAMVDVNINKSPVSASGKSIYRIDGAAIYDASGLDIDNFGQYLSDANRELKAGQSEKALALFNKAIGSRPFLINYVLGRYGLSDLGWITNERDMRSWTHDISDYSRINGVGDVRRKVAAISSIIDDEIDDYIKCLFFAAYLEGVKSSVKSAGELISQIHYLDSDVGRVVSLLDREDAVQSNPKIKAFLHGSGFYRYFELREEPKLLTFITGLLLDKDLYNR